MTRDTMKEFAGTMRERVEVLRRTAGQDALGEGEEDWTVIDFVWASGEPIGRGAAYVADAAAGQPRWRMWLRPCDVRVGDRIERVSNSIEVQEVIADPAAPDRVTVTGEERRR